MKTAYLALPPGDKGPACSYSPICSPPSVYTAVWHEQTIVVSESAMDVSTENLERAAMERWVLQLVHRELAGVLEEAETQLKLVLTISLDDVAARVIKQALEIRVREQGLAR
ncbi:MAG TPA: hypothetical protein VJA21_17135 [Verrucomicrobiae bacterium]